jgi:hypothetical protein
MELHSKLQFCHEGTKTQRDDMYFNLGALESLWQNEHYPSFFLDQTGRFSGQGGAYMKLHMTNAEVGMWKDGVALRGAGATTSTSRRLRSVFLINKNR